MVDRNTSLNRTADGGICGTEIITVTIAEKGSFDVLANFTGTPASTPGLYALNETGSIAKCRADFLTVMKSKCVVGPTKPLEPAMRSVLPCDRPSDSDKCG